MFGDLAIRCWYVAGCDFNSNSVDNVHCPKAAWRWRRKKLLQSGEKLVAVDDSVGVTVPKFETSQDDFFELGPRDLSIFIRIAGFQKDCAHIRAIDDDTKSNSAGNARAT